MSYRAGSAFVDVKPDMSTFQDDIKAELARTPDLAIKVTADTTDAKARLDELGAASKATVTADADTRPAEAQLDALTKKKRTAVIDVTEKLQKGGTLTDLLNPVGLGATAAVALGPQALGLGAGLLGVGAGFAAAAADAGAFGIIAKGMFTDVEAAQKKLTAAQQAYNAATTDKGRAKALADEKAALAGLTPAERQLATELTGLSAAWKQLKDSEQPVVGQALAPWLQAAIPGMQLLKPLITDGAGAVALLGSEAKTALADPFWGQFFNTLGVTGQIALTDFGNAVGHVGDGLAHLFVTFAPDIARVLPLVDKAATAFDNWGRSVTSGGLDNFLSTTFSPANVHALAQDGKDLASFVENVAQASKDMSPLAFGGISNVLDILGSLPPGVIEAATALFLAVKTIGTISQAAGAVGGFINGVKGLFGGGAQTAEATAEGTAAGTAGGTSAATAFTSTFAAEVTAALPAAFTEVGATGATEAGTAGTAMGTAAAAAFGTAFGAEDAIGVTAGLAAVGTGASAEAGVAGGAMGSAMAAAFTAAFDTEGMAEIGASLGAASLVAVLAAGVLGATLGAAVGIGFGLGLGASGISGAAGKIKGDVQGGAAGASTWLQPAAQQAAQGFITAWNAEGGAIRAAVGQLKGWTQQAAAGSNTWIQPHGQQAGQGFATGLAGAHAIVNNGAAQLKNWVTAALPNPVAWLVNQGVSVMQGFLNGLISEYGAVQSFVSSIAGWIAANKGPVEADYQLLQPHGRAIMGGFGDALQAGFNESVAPVISGVAPAVLAGMAGAQSLGALSQLGIAAPARLPGVGSPVSGGQLQLVVTPGVSDAPVMSAIVNGLQFHVQGTTGGDVQAALGLGPVR